MRANVLHGNNQTGVDTAYGDWPELWVMAAVVVGIQTWYSNSDKEELIARRPLFY